MTELFEKRAKEDGWDEAEGGKWREKECGADLLQQKAVDAAGEPSSAMALYTHPSGHTPGLKLRRFSGVTSSQPEG